MSCLNPRKTSRDLLQHVSRPDSPTAVSNDASWTIHFQVLDKSPLLGPGRGPPSCNSGKPLDKESTRKVHTISSGKPLPASSSPLHNQGSTLKTTSSNGSYYFPLHLTPDQQKILALSCCQTKVPFLNLRSDPRRCYLSEIPD